MIDSADPRMKRVFEIAASVAASRASVLITGESGTGKEVLARFVHQKSTRARAKFVALNCAAIPENLLESELFGFERGAFTGADQRKAGKFEQAHDGTFLLDEISEMPLVLQAKILRVLQEGEVERLGGFGPVKVNVRIIATTNRSLEDMVRAGTFREDLYYRLNVIPLALPALRTRPLDVERFARTFTFTACEENGLGPKSLSPAALEMLKGYAWPGNVRELRNVIERSVLLSGGATLIEGDQILLPRAMRELHAEPSLTAGMTVGEAERLLIIKTLEHTSQNRTRAAEMLGISIRTLRNKLNEYRSAV